MGPSRDTRPDEAHRGSLTAAQGGAYTIRRVSRLLHLAMVLFLVLTTGMAHVLPSELGCADEAADAQVGADCACCEHDPSEDTGALTDEGCGDLCVFCVCCPVRTAITSAVPSPPEPVLVQGSSPPAYRAHILGAKPGDIFQPPRA